MRAAVVVPGERDLPLRAARVELDAGVLQVVAGDVRDLGHQVRADDPARLAVLLEEDLGAFGQAVRMARLQELLGVLGALRLLNDLELEEAGLLEDVRHHGDAGDLDQDARGPLAGDDGLLDAGRRVVDAPADHLERLEHRALAGPACSRRRSGSARSSPRRARRRWSTSKSSASRSRTLLDLGRIGELELDGVWPSPTRSSLHLVRREARLELAAQVPELVLRRDRQVRARSPCGRRRAGRARGAGRRRAATSAPCAPRARSGCANTSQLSPSTSSRVAIIPERRVTPPPRPCPSRRGVRHRLPVELDAHLLVDAEVDGQHVVGGTYHDAVEAAAGHDPVALLDRLQHVVVLALLLLLGPDQQQVEDQP